MAIINELIDRNRPIISIKPDDTVYDALALMAKKNIGALLVLENSKLVGIISERDYARNVILEGRASNSTAVKEIMTSKLIYISPNDKTEECMALMTEKRIRHLPVLEAGELVGIVSIGDLVKAMLANQKFHIEELERYISGSY